MHGAWFDNLVDWIGAHPVAAGVLVLLIAFCDALVLVGIVVPALPLLFAVGTLIGLGHINGPYAVACAALGAFLGDGLSYWAGRRWGPQMRDHWAFRRYPQLLDRGELLFRRHGASGIGIARFVGAVRPFVPAIAGMLRMPMKRYVPASALACLAWAAVFLAPGWIFGHSYDAVAAVADRLALVLLALVAALALAWAVVLYTWRWFAVHAHRLAARTLRWSHAHPRLGRLTVALVDPTRREAPSLLVLALALIVMAWLMAGLVATLLAQGGPLGIDHRIAETMFALRNPLADRLMAALALLGSLPVLATAAALALAWLLWRRRWLAAGHWLAAISFGLALTAALGALVSLPPPANAPSGFSFPAIAPTMTTVVFGFFAVLIARELPGRRRVWPYLVTGAVVVAVSFAHLYLGAHWTSDVTLGVLLGTLWLLLLGIAYRRHAARPFYMRPLAWLFYCSFAVAALWYTPRASQPMLARFVPPPATSSTSVQAWWNGDWRRLPAHRPGRAAWPLDVQVAGQLPRVQALLRAEGWVTQAPGTWTDVLAMLDDDTPPQQRLVLPAALDAHAEALLLRRPVAGSDAIDVLRLWPAPMRLEDGTPLWIGTTQRLHPQQVLRLVTFWQLAPPADTRDRLHEHLQGWPMQDSAAAPDAAPVLRVDLR